MASKNLPSSPASVLFPSTRLACGMFDSVEIIRSPAPDLPQILHQLAALAAKPTLGQCDFEDEYCDCREAAVVHDLSSDQEFCVRHFLAVSRG